MASFMDCGVMRRLCTWHIWKRVDPPSFQSSESAQCKNVTGVTSDLSQIYASTDCSSHPAGGARSHVSHGIQQNGSPDRKHCSATAAATQQDAEEKPKEEVPLLPQESPSCHANEYETELMTPTLCSCFKPRLTGVSNRTAPVPSAEVPRVLTWRRSRRCRLKLGSGCSSFSSTDRYRVVNPECAQGATPMVHHNSNRSTRSTTKSMRRFRSRLGSFFSALSRESLTEAHTIIQPYAGATQENQSPRLSRSGFVDSPSDYYSLDDDTDEVDDLNFLSQQEPDNHCTAVCESCGNLCHVRFVPEMPLVTQPGVTPDSYEERLIIARSFVGRWVTILERSETLDSQYRQLGLGIVKRAVMNRLAIPLTMFLEEEDTLLHCWVHTPLGIRHMRSNLKGEECVDDDPDAGRWTGTSCIVDYSIPWFCGGRAVRALQQTRFNPKVGRSVETRCVLPDKAEGKIMLFSFVMFPKGKPNEKLSADRILKVSDHGLES